MKMRTPLNNPNGMPPDHVIRRPGLKSVTSTGKARSGLASDLTLIFSPSAMWPSTYWTPESQEG
jgi:hypothetical protein